MGEGYRRLLARLEGARTLGVSFGLDRIRAALARLGSPERAYVTVQVAGTNGKGSTAAMTEAILRAAGLRTGLFTSPHLCRFTERIRIDGREIDGERLAALDPAVVATGVPLTYFEISAVLAFRAFAEAHVDVAVLETGLGGRLDAVTAASPVATAITSIGLDHTELLGGTLPEIAREKAGIAKPGVPLYLGPLPPEADGEIAHIAASVGASVHRYSVDLAPADAPALAGPHQRANATLAVALARSGATARGRTLSDATIAAGLRAVVWPGRLEWLAPDVLVDCAHNQQGAEALVAALPPERPTALVLSVVRGKDAAGMLAVLAPHFALVVATRSRNERALPAAELGALLRDQRVEVVEDPAAALALARGFADEHPDGYVVVAGSIFLVGELRARLLGEPVDPLPGGDPLP
jgi:dihydrofolate synthase/folylpolyglutamate synthase